MRNQIDSMFRRRHGLATVEMALLLPLLLLLTFGMIEYGWLLMRAHQVTNAARHGARVAATADTTTAEAQAAVDQLMGNIGLSSGQYTIAFDPGIVENLGRGETLSCQVTVPYENVGLPHVNLFPVPSQLQASVTMAREGP